MTSEGGAPSLAPSSSSSAVSVNGNVELSIRASQTK